MQSLKVVQNFDLAKFCCIFAKVEIPAMTLSIIVPVYNVEKHLERCIKSIIAQGLTDYELILVDDGSTDHSGALCDELQREHGCISVIHRANGGLSAARNTGIVAAKGRYITFVDSDDELCQHTLKENLEYLTCHPEIDMLEYPVEVHADSPQAYRLSFPNETQATDIFADWIRREGYAHCYAWNKIYRTEVWSGTCFPVDAYYEDTAVMPDIVRRCRSIHYSSHGCYRYIKHPGSITTSYRYDKQRQLFENNHRLYIAIKDDATLYIEAMRLWISCLNQLIDLGRCSDADQSDYAAIVEEAERHHPAYKALIKAAPNAATRVKLLPLPVVGLSAYCRAYIALTKPLQP